MKKDASPQGAEGSANDELDELEEDSIVASRSEAHAPLPPTEVRMDEASIVIPDEVADEGDQARLRKTHPAGLPPYKAPSQDPTVVVDRTVTAQVRRKSSGGLAGWMIWVGASVVAFGFGGFLATMTGSEDDPTGKAVQIEAPAAAESGEAAARAASPSGADEPVEVEDDELDEGTPDAAGTVARGPADEGDEPEVIDLEVAKSRPAVPPKPAGRSPAKQAPAPKAPVAAPALSPWPSSEPRRKAPAPAEEIPSGI